MKIIDLTDDILFFQIFSKLDEKSFCSLRLINKKIQSLIDRKRSHLFFCLADTHQIVRDDATIPVTLSQRCINLTKLRLHLDDLYYANALSNLLSSLEHHWPKNLFQLELTSPTFKDYREFFQKISNPLLLKIKYRMDEKIAAKEAEVPINLLLKANTNLISLHIDSFSNTSINIAFYHCKNLKEIKYTGCLPISKTSFEFFLNSEKCQS